MAPAYTKLIKSSFSLLILLIACMLISQCKKNPGNSTSNGCVASTQIDSASGTWIYTYDSQGRVTEDSLAGGSSVGIGSTAYLNYAGSSVNITYTLGPENITVTLNSAGFPVSATTPDGNSFSATYNTNGNLNTLTVTSFGTPTTYTAVYANGNIVALTNNGSNAATFTYYSNAVTVPYDPLAKIFALSGDWSDVPSGSGCGLSNCGFSWGFNPQPFSKNLVKSISNIPIANNSGTYGYQYDSKGNVTYVSAVMPIPGIDTTTAVAYYSYNCQ